MSTVQKIKEEYDLKELAEEFGCKCGIPGTAETSTGTEARAGTGIDSDSGNTGNGCC